MISRYKYLLFSLLVTLLPVLFVTKSHGQQILKTVRTFPAEEAQQGVAVDSSFFYAIASRSIGKYDKKTGRRMLKWKEEPDGPILHLDSGVIVDGKLYAAHSNYPQIPMTSSVEIWNARTLDHIGSHSFGIRWGSLTWLDRYDGFWWGTFAHYERFEEQVHKNNRWTKLIQFNDQWEPLESWMFPEEVLERFGEMSNSGGSWGPDGLLYISGHDLPELYVMQLPKAGSVLKLVKIINVENEGQGVAWDRSGTERIYSIRRSSQEVVISEK